MAYTQDPQQQIGDAIQYGVVASVDHANATCTVTLGDLDTGDLPWVAQRAGGLRCWSPPSVGEQCVVLAPEGDLANGLVIMGLYSDASPPPSTDPNVSLVEYPDGAVIAYDHAAHALTATLPAGGTVAIDASGGITITGDTVIKGNATIDGDLHVTGTITADTDVLGGGISLKSHKHGQVQAGTAQTGAPV